MQMPLPVRLLHIASIAVTLAVIDWSLKTWALIDLRPDQVVLNTDRPWHLLPVAVLGFVTASVGGLLNRRT